MARQQERLVKAIRTRRRALTNSAQETVQQTVGSLDSVRDSVRRYPAAWAIGGTIVGIVAVRSFGGSVVRSGGKLAGRWAQKRVGDALFAVALKAVDSVRAEVNAYTTRPRPDPTPEPTPQSTSETANEPPVDRPPAAEREEPQPFMNSGQLR